MPDPVLTAREVAHAAIDRGAPGIVYGIVADGEPVATGALGKLDEGAVVRVGSITKVFTAIAVAQLVERGAVGWDDPVDRHLRSYPFRPARGARPATVREVLTHTGGFGEFRRLREWRSKAIPFGVDDGEPIPSLRDFYADGLRATTAPGRGYAYANHAFASLGQLVEDVTGIEYAAYVKERILDPLGMSSSSIVLTDELRPRLAQGYHVDGEQTVEVPLQHIVIAPAGALFSTLADMLRFVGWASTGGGRAVLRPETLAVMMQRHFEPDTRLPGQGLGFACDDVAGTAVAGHDGGWPGFTSSFSVIPSLRFGAFACVNAIDLAAKNTVDRTIEARLGAAPPAERLPRDIPAPVDRARFAGVYAPILGLSADARWWNEYGGELRIGVTADGLVLTSPRGPHARGTPLRPTDDPCYWMGTVERLGSHQLVRIRFAADGGSFDGGVPQIARMRKRPAVRSVRVYKPIAKATPVAVVSATAALLLRRRGRARSGRTARRSRRR